MKHRRRPVLPSALFASRLGRSLTSRDRRVGSGRRLIRSLPVGGDAASGSHRVKSRRPDWRKLRKRNKIEGGWSRFGSLALWSLGGSSAETQ